MTEGRFPSFDSIMSKGRPSGRNLFEETEVIGRKVFLTPEDKPDDIFSYKLMLHLIIIKYLRLLDKRLRQSKYLDKLKMTVLIHSLQ